MPEAKAATGIERIAGASRYDTASMVAGVLHPDGADTAVVASGASYADALTAGVAAAALDAPLLLASKDVVPTEEVEALGAQRVLLIGGTAALPDSVAFRLASLGTTVERVAGADRYETAAKVAERAVPDATHVFRAAGESFQAALVAAVHAARVGGRLELVDGMAADTVVVDGVSLRGTPGELDAELLDRFPPTGRQAIVTTISSFPDALAASALAGALDAAVLFTERHSATESAVDLLRALDPASVIVVGGTGAVSERVLQQLFGYVPLPPVVGPNAENQIALDLFVRMNDERRARGVPALVWDGSLASGAAAWAREMSTSGFAHDALPSSLGENIHMPIGLCDASGACTYPTSGRVNLDWMRDGANRDNVLEMGYVLGGVGVHCGPDGTLWAVARFGIGFGGLTAGGTDAEPVARGDAGGFDCTGRHT